MSEHVCSLTWAGGDRNSEQLIFLSTQMAPQSLHMDYQHKKCMFSSRPIYVDDFFECLQYC